MVGFIKFNPGFGSFYDLMTVGNFYLGEFSAKGGRDRVYPPHLYSLWVRQQRTATVELRENRGFVFEEKIAAAVHSGKVFDSVFVDLPDKFVTMWTVKIISLRYVQAFPSPVVPALYLGFESIATASRP